MFKRILLGATAVAVLAGVALADTTATNTQTPPAPDQGQMQPDQQASQDGPPPDDSGWGNWWRHGNRHGGHGDHGGRGMRGPGMGGPGMDGPPPMMAGSGFKLHLGKDIDVGIMCGATPFKDCIAAAQPLIDAAKATAANQTPTKTP